jgi:uncharacterized protein YbaP (TraB family)
MTSILALIASLSAFGTVGREPVAQPTTLQEATSGPANIAIWRAGDEDTTVYLMGTVHILNPGIEWSTPAFKAAWAETDAVYFEADVMSPEAIQAAAPAIRNHGFFTDGRKLADLFAIEEQRTINDGLAKLGLSLEALGNLRPWLAGLQVAQAAMMKVGGDPEAGMEMILGRKAEAEGIEARYFETLAQQIGFLSSISDEEQARSFLAAMSEIDDVEAFFAEMIGYWYRGDADALADFMTQEWQDLPELSQTLLFDRNQAWADELSSLIENEQGTFFIAVGAAHLAGEKSVQDYLEQEGYPSTRMNP